MDMIGTVLSAAQTLLASLQCSELQEILSIFGYKSQLDDLRRTVSAVNAVLLDAEAKQELSHEAQYKLQELKDAVFEADDLLDEFVSLAQQKQLLEAGGSLAKKVCHFFSDNPLGVAYRMSRGVKKIRKKLDAIAYNTQFSLKHDPEPIRRRRPETCSYVDSGDIIGRNDDLEKIVGMMLDSNVQRDVSFLTIVGIGGLGKTTLAQLVHNDPRITSAFPLRLWTCVSDQDQKQLDVKDILYKILASAAHKPQKDSTMDQVQKQLRNQLAGKKYLLVLDDVWSEKCDQWRDLERFLIGGQKGCWILVTTRSLATAKIIGDGLTYKLQGLSDVNSWCLFERVAFGLQSSNPPDDLVKIGEEIVKGCARVPLAIRVIGSLLYGQDKSKWLSVVQIPLANLRESHNDIMPILKLSYHNLESPLKSCFSYCALFPKDYRIEKEMLISLWMAQGYIVPLDEGQSIEGAAEEYLSILLRRCFFQDIVRHVIYGDIVSFKIHDLMHDVAQTVTKQEIYATDNLEGNLDDKVCHLSVKNKVARCSLYKSHIRTFLLFGRREVVRLDQFFVEAQIANCIRLRVLDLSCIRIKTLPESIGELLHLRYLDLSLNRLEVLPKSITKLCNLQTLKLSDCIELKELPKDLSKLVKLRTLFTDFCLNMTCFPKGMGKLNCLHTLSDFIVGGVGSYSTTRQWLDGLEDLKAMNNLKGRLDICFKWPKNVVKVDDISTEGHYLRSKEHLKGLMFHFCHQEIDEGVGTEEARRFMEELQPHLNLKVLSVRGYRGVRMPGWTTLLPNLVSICLEDCTELEYLPCLGTLQHLKFLSIVSLPKLEYIEISQLAFSSTSESECAQGVTIFPSLENLDLWYLPKFKGWRDNINLQLCLSHLYIKYCPELTCIPLCLKVDDLLLRSFNKRLKILQTRGGKIGEVPPSSSVFSGDKLSRSLFDTENSSKSSSIPTPMLRYVKIDNAVWLNSLPMVTLQSLERLNLEKDGGDMESLKEVEEVFHNCSSSLQILKFKKSVKLRSVCGGLEHLTALKKLVIRNCPNVRLSEETEDGRPWRSLHHSLCDLRFYDLPQLVNLPDWMQSLASLKYLYIRDCKRLESLPNWMPKLTSLKQLELLNCSDSLKSRCQKDPPGEDWPYIKHIPIINFRKNFFFMTCTRGI
ncbi:putative disease resistance protein RGA4 isoform X2 [Chenopodium quinoa]|uniref:Disease resistance protein RGA3 n=1 Tax=Chenopodium quinoa TaxID=63459 RepID=A0A803LMK2_CHEQI|nr:putative disease resistance protein RGA4 isoform X2 [Chenopodium quinoa]